MTGGDGVMGGGLEWAGYTGYGCSGWGSSEIAGTIPHERSLSSLLHALYLLISQRHRFLVVRAVDLD